MIGIYKIENLINHKKYIGQSINIEKRWKAEKNSAFNEKSNAYDYPISRAFRKYGLENFSFEVIEECSLEELNEREKYWISKFNSFFKGYNQTLGGDTHIIQLKENILGIFFDLENTDMIHSDIAEKWKVSVEMVQGINTGRYWYREDVEYPIQERCKKRGQGRTKRYCPICKKEISQKATLCTECHCKQTRKVERPCREELKNLIRTMPFTKIGKIYNVTDNAIRKWCDSYNLPRKATEIKKYSDEEWKNI